MLRAEVAALRADVAGLLSRAAEATPQWQPAADRSVPAGVGERLAAERVALFRSLFVGRDEARLAARTA